MSAAFEVPTQPQNQQFNVFLNGIQYTLQIRWNKFTSAWSMDIYDVNQNPVLLGTPLVTGADLLAQFEYLEIGGQMIVQSDGTTDTVPTFQDLGSTGHLYFVVSDAQAASN